MKTEYTLKIGTPFGEAGRSELYYSNNGKCWFFDNGERSFQMPKGFDPKDWPQFFKLRSYERCPYCSSSKMHNAKVKENEEKESEK